MRINLYRMKLQNWVALGNLSAIGVALIAILLWSEACVFEYRLPWEPRQGLASVAQYAVIALSFPVGWIGFPRGPISWPGVLAWGMTNGMFVPLNAYLWGCVVTEIVNLRRRKPIEQAAAADEDN